MSKSVAQIKNDVVETVAETAAAGAEKVAEGSERLATATKNAAGKTRDWADETTGARDRQKLFAVLAALTVIGLIIAFAASRRSLPDAEEVKDNISDFASDLSDRIS